MTPKAAARIIFDERQNGIHCPPTLQGLFSLEQGYQVQLELLALELAAGEAQAGWKVGLTSKDIQQQVGVHERVFGYLLNSAERKSGLTLQTSALINPHFENELCVTLSQTLSGPGVTLEQARAAISGVAPAVEVIERRSSVAADLPLAMADNAEQKFFVTGAFTTPLPPDLELLDTALEICIDGQVVESAQAAAVLEGPPGSVAWLANRLAGFGMRLEAGCKVMTGSFTRQYPARPGERYETRYTPFGPVIIQVQ